MRIVFMGTPDFAVPALLALAQSHDIVAVYSKEAKPAGRGMDVQASPVAREAGALGLQVLTPATLKSPDAIETLRGHQADVAVVVAYGLMLPKAVLDLMPHGCFNIHASLLPRWRGAAPINRAIMAGDGESGISIMKMDEGLDTGDIALMDRLPIASDMTAGDLHDALARLGADAIVRALAALERGTLKLTPQPAGSTYAAKIGKDEARIDWSRPWQAVHNHIRGLSPFPGAWFSAADGMRVKVLRSTRGDGAGAPGTVLDDKLTVACGEGAVRLTQLQRAGKQPMQAEEFLRGMPVKPGTFVG